MLDFREPRWGLAEILIVYIGILVIGLVFGMSGDMVTSLIESLKMPATKLSYFYVGFAVQFITTVCLVVCVVIWLNQAELRDIGINNVSFTTYLKYGLTGGIVLLIVIFALSWPLNLVQPELEPQLYEEMLRTVTANKDFIVLFIIGAVLAPLSEELFYRGMLYPILRHKFGPVVAIIMAGAIFGIVHWDLWRTIPLAVGGMILCYIYEKTNSIFVTALAHGFWNGVMSLVVYFSMLRTF